MLSRGTSCSSTRLRRAKSSSSVNKRSSARSDDRSLDQENGHQQALAAATYAFGRAYDIGNDHKQPQRSCGASPSKSNVLAASSTDDARSLRRNKSIRFAGPAAEASRRKSITRTDVTAQRINPVSGPHAPKINSRSSSIGLPEESMTALPQCHGQGSGKSTPSPSSYRKLRKSKSMFAPRKAPSIFFAHSTPMSDGRYAFYKDMPSSNEDRRSQEDLQDRTSASFLRGGMRYMLRPSFQAKSQDAAIQTARDQFLHDLDQQRLREKPSFLNLGKQRRFQKDFRKFARVSSDDVNERTVEPLQEEITNVVKGKRFGRKARDISNSLKNKLKKLFDRSTPERQLPPQQLDASRPHFHDYVSATSGILEAHHAIPAPDANLLHRAESRNSNSHPMPVEVEQGGSPASIRRISSDETINATRSRVTSWTNSTVANTISSNLMLEKKRLSIIQENGGPHQPSSSARQFSNAARNGYAIFRKPVRKGSGRISGPVDSQRMFSALQKRLDENLQAQEDNEYYTDTEQEDFESLERGSVTSSQRTTTCTSRTNPTIRLVSNASSTTIRSDHDVETSKSIVDRSTPVEDSQDAFRCSTSSTRPQRPDSVLSALRMGLTPQQIAEHNERNEQVDSRRKEPLKEMRSSFFPPSSHYQNSRISPYMRILRDSIEETRRPPTAHDRSQGRARSVTPLSQDTQVKRNRSGTTESAYSRSTSGNSPREYENPFSHVSSTDHGESDSAVIMVEGPISYEYPIPPSPHQKQSSIRSSSDWKAFLASEVANLERDVTRLERERNAGNDIHPSQRFGHRREHAQINDDDVEANTRLNSKSSKRSLARARRQPSQRPGVNHKTSDRMIERFPVFDRGALSNPSIQEQYLAPSVQRPSNLQRRPSSSENRKLPSPNANLFRNDLHRKTSRTSPHSQGSSSTDSRALVDSTNIIGTQNKDPIEPSNQRGKLTPRFTGNPYTRNSPERIERLKRMRSTNSLISRGSSHNEGVNPNYHQRENQVIHESSSMNLPRAQSLYHTASLPGSSPTYVHAADSHEMVDRFLSSRRKRMTTSEYDGDESVFL
ncbi:hypothetical protein MMC20_003340 [Loxospora ochrophaea]|nr:hypothetical protein [Loxospora ochrophaea]